MELPHLHLQAGFFRTYITEHKLEIVQDLEDLYIQEDQNAVFMCELSLEEVAGEWYKDGHKIRPSSTIKIRNEGQRTSRLQVLISHQSTMTESDLLITGNISQLK